MARPSPTRAASSVPGRPHAKRPGGRRGVILLAVAFALVTIGAFSLVQAAKAGREALRAKAALLSAEQHLSLRDLTPARTDLATAREAFGRMRTELDGLGPILPVAKVIPILRSQVVAVETFQSAGVRLSDAGLRLADAAQKVLENNEGRSPLSGLLDNLEVINASLASGAENVRLATRQVKGLEGKWLVGPIAGARNDLLSRLPRYERQATSSAEGVDALIRFVGGAGPRRYLFLSQNPDEIRPTGGFFGTYGILTAVPGGLTLERFESTGHFLTRYPNVVVPGGQAGSPFRHARPPRAQSLANTNNTADFAAAGKLAAELWNRAGEPPVDGVVSFTPAFLARILGVLGPVVVSEYGETVDQGNLIERFDFYTQELERDLANDVTRKGFVSALGEVVMQKLLAAPSSSWQALGEAIGQGFEAREAMVWAEDPQVTKALTNRGWDGVLPHAVGDFFYNGEFSYEGKANRSLQRTFDHHVELRPDGSARITTTMTVTNPRPRSNINLGSLSYVTVYGPAGAVLDPASDGPSYPEPELSGHPAAGWFLNAEPLGRATVKVVWEAKNIARKGPNGTRVYSLRWLRVPDHKGDTLNLRVDLPDGWRWASSPPPSRIELTDDVDASWTLSTSGLRF